MLAATCLATDLGMGFPFEHGLHATLMAMRLADALEVDDVTATEVFYVCLLMYAGCTTDAATTSRIFGQSVTDNVTPHQFGPMRDVLAGVIRALPPQASRGLGRTYEIARRAPAAIRQTKPHFTALCEVATMLADGLGLPDPVPNLFAFLVERWDGNGILGRARHDEIPRSLRIVHAARDAAYQRLLGGDDHATTVVTARGGQGLDPSITTTFARHASDVLGAAEVPSAWEAVMDAEPAPRLVLEGQEIDRALGAMGALADLLSPSFSGHSRGVADLTRAAAVVAGFTAPDVAAAYRSALVHDVGRVAVDPKTWNRPGPLAADEWEGVRLHGYHTERVLSRSPRLAVLGEPAGSHHERLDGSGYHRRVSAPNLDPVARLVAVADAFHAMTEPRPHRKALPSDQAAELVARDTGRFDPDLAAAVLETSGQAVPPMERPGGLTERECAVVGLLSRGLQTKQVARLLEISVKTADTHIQNAYRKLGVSTRAAATVYAMEHGLVPSGELPISSGPGRS